MFASRGPARIGLVVLVVAGPRTVAAAPAEVPVQRPANTVPVTSAPTATNVPVAPTPTPTAGTPTAPAETGAHAPSSPTTPTTADPGSAPSAQPVAPAEPGGTQPPGMAEQLLGPSVNQHPDKRPPAPVPTESDAAASEDAAIAAMYRDM